jgi:putative nucleotidyltransferase with HDIG domain
LSKLFLTRLSIRTKLTLPYVLLSLLIALGGGIIVTRVMIDSLEDRFTNQLIETRKLASELMVREEGQLLETLRLISYTEGVPAAIRRRDQSEILERIYPLTFNAGEDVVLVLSSQGMVLASILRSEETGEYRFPQIDEKLDALPFVARLVDENVDEIGDKYSGLSNADWGTYFFVSGPVHDGNGNLAGVILVGKSLKGIVQKVREETLSQATLYDLTFHPLSSTFIEMPASPDINPETVLETKDAQSLLRDVNISSLAYTEILSSWEIRDGENIGFLGTALPKTFLVRASRVTRWNVTLQVILAITAALFLGILLSRHITRPILQLKNAASEISKGNLDIHVETDGTDEVAVLAKAFDEMAFSLRRSEKSLISDYDKTIENWVQALELRDRETLGHTLRVANLTIRLARLMNIEEGEIEHIRRGVLLHDIGKMGIQDDILLKKGPLDDWEREIIEKHPALAREILSQIEFLHPCIGIPAYHHERWDGRGYPDGLAGEEIPMVARIFAVIDVWDALTSDRPYRKAWSMDAALQYIKKNAGRHFDPQVVQVFLQWIKLDNLEKADEKTVLNSSMSGEVSK